MTSGSSLGTIMTEISSPNLLLEKDERKAPVINPIIKYPAVRAEHY